MNTKISYTALIVAVLSLAFSLSLLFSVQIGQNEKQQFIPDRNQYTRLVVRNDVLDLVEVWQKRYDVNVAIAEEEKEVVVLITTANGEGPVEDSLYLKEAVRPRIESSVSQFDWLDDYELTITIM